MATAGVVVAMLSDEEDNTNDGRVKASVVDWSSDANLSIQTTLLMLVRVGLFRTPPHSSLPYLQERSNTIR